MAIENPVIQGAGSAVVGAIRTAARATGTNSQYLLATARWSPASIRMRGCELLGQGLFHSIDQNLADDPARRRGRRSVMAAMPTRSPSPWVRHPAKA